MCAKVMSSPPLPPTPLFSSPDAPHLTIGLGTKHDILGQWSQSASEASAPGVSPTDSNGGGGTSSSNLPKSLLVGEHSPLLELNCHIKANPWIDQVIWHVNGAPITPTSSSTSASLEPFYSSAVAAVTYSHAQFEAHSKRTSSSSTQNHSQLPPPLTPLPPSSIYLTNHNQTLRLENVARLHAGQYQCAARNLINVTFSEPVQLNVACKCPAKHHRHTHRHTG